MHERTAELNNSSFRHNYLTGGAGDFVHRIAKSCNLQRAQDQSRSARPERQRRIAPDADRNVIRVMAMTDRPTDMGVQDYREHQAAVWAKVRVAGGIAMSLRAVRDQVGQCARGWAHRDWGHSNMTPAVFREGHRYATRTSYSWFRDLCCSLVAQLKPLLRVAGIAKVAAPQPSREMYKLAHSRARSGKTGELTDWQPYDTIYMRPRASFLESRLASAATVIRIVF